MRRREGEGLRKADNEIWTVSLKRFFTFRGWLYYEKNLDGRGERGISMSGGLAISWHRMTD